MPEDRRSLRSAARAVALYYRRTKLEPVRDVWRQTWGLGTSARVLLVLLGATFLITALPLTPPGRALSQLALFVIAWSAAVAAAASTRRGVVPLLILSPWLVFYSVLAAGAWIATPVIVIPVAWIVWVAWRLLAQQTSGSRAIVCWLAIAAAAAYVSAGPMGLRRLLDTDIWIARALLALVVASAAIPLFTRRTEPARSPLSFAFVLTGSLIACTAAIGAAAYRDLSFTSEWTRLVFVDASAIVVLLWLWTAGSFAAGSLKFGRLLVETGGAIVREPWVRLGVPLVMAAAIAARSWWADPLAAVDRLHLAGLVVELAVSVIAVVWAGVQAIRGAPSAIMLRGLTVWLLSCAVVEGVIAGADAVVRADTARGALFGAALISVVAGLFIELGKLGREWASRSSSRGAVHLAFIVVALSCAVALMAGGGNQWQTSQALMALTGMIHLGVPVALYEVTRKADEDAPALPTAWRIGMFATGYVCGMAALAIDPRRAWPLLVTGALLIVLLDAMRRSLPVIRPFDGALAGALFGGGLIAGWMLPYPPTIPFLPVPPLASVLRDLGSLGRPLLSLPHLWMLTIAWTTCGAAGWAIIAAAKGAARASYQTP